MRIDVLCPNAYYAIKFENKIISRTRLFIARIFIVAVAGNHSFIIIIDCLYNRYNIFILFFINIVVLLSFSNYRNLV